MKLKEISDITLKEVLHYETCLPSDYLTVFNKYLKTEKLTVDFLIKQKIEDDIQRSRKILKESENILMNTSEIIEEVYKDSIEKDKNSDLKEKMKFLIDKVNEMNKEINTDELTGALNRKWLFNFYLKNEDIFPENGVISFIDINKFKDINDTYGHHIGDMSLKFFTKFFKGKLNKKDFFIRYAGDEFIVISTSSNLNEKIKQIRKSLNSAKLFLKNNQKISFTLDFAYGIEEFKKGNSFNKIFQKVDTKMYKEKKTKK